MSIAADGPQAEIYRASPVEPWRVVRTRLRVAGKVPGPIEGGGRASGYFTGATGITIYRGNAWPRECVELFNLCGRGQFEPARALYKIMIDAFHLDTHVKLVQYIKFAEYLTYGASEHLRAPHLVLTGAERERVAAIIERTKAELARRKRVA